jgi:hypothetical protein
LPGDHPGNRALFEAATDARQSRPASQVKRRSTNVQPGEPMNTRTLGLCVGG